MRMTPEVNGLNPQRFGLGAHVGCVPTARAIDINIMEGKAGPSVAITPLFKFGHRVPPALAQKAAPDRSSDRQVQPFHRNPSRSRSGRRSPAKLRASEVEQPPAQPRRRGPWTLWSTTLFRFCKIVPEITVYD